MRKLNHNEIKASRKTLLNINEYKRNPIYVVSDSIRSIYNIGSIFRTSDAAFVKKLYLTGYSPYPPRKEIEKVALGATLSVPWEYRKDAVELIKELKSRGIKICILELTDFRNMYWELEKKDFPICLVLGNEITGVSKEIIDIADLSIELPMLGIKQSLNVSVAYGISVYEMLRKLNYE